MVVYGEYLKISVQNLAQWTQQLEELVPVILDSPTKKNISDLVALTEQMLNGIDLDNNGTVDPIAGESGAQFAYQYAYSMADMPLFNTGLVTTATPGGGLSTGGGGGTNGGGGGNTAPTPRPGNTPPGQVKTEKPKNDPPGGGQSNNNNKP
jgi:hypothetical protein